MASTAIAPSAAATPATNGPTLAPFPVSAAFKPMASSAPDMATSKTMLSKDWVIPPRPKPGRKPATDTPPTRRTAQNRAAQRAFRERRAALTGELQEQLEEQRRDHEEAHRRLQGRIVQLEVELSTARSECRALQNLLDRERLEKTAAHEELRRLQRSGGHAAHAMTEYLSRPGHGSGPNVRNPSSISQPAINSPVDPLPASGGDCGGCRPNGRCVCDEAVNAVVRSMAICKKCEYPSRCECIDKALAPLQPQHQASKRQSSPISTPSREKRARAGEELYSSLETDFTATATCLMRQPMETPDGRENWTSTITKPVHTPLPCDSDPIRAAQGPVHVDSTSIGAFGPPTTGTQPTKMLCGPSGPGTCDQCIQDPNGCGRFCRMLAPQIQMQIQQQRQQQGDCVKCSGCCGGGGGGRGCCRDVINQATPATASSTTRGLSPNLNARFTVAETYRTLLSHPSFEEAFNEVDTWLPTLRPAAPTALAPATSLASASRIPVEVEAASVMSVLRHFDVRFRRDC